MYNNIVKMNFIIYIILYNYITIIKIDFWNLKICGKFQAPLILVIYRVSNSNNNFEIWWKIQIFKGKISIFWTKTWIKFFVLGWILMKIDMMKENEKTKILVYHNLYLNHYLLVFGTINWRKWWFRPKFQSLRELYFP